MKKDETLVNVLFGMMLGIYVMIALILVATFAMRSERTEMGCPVNYRADGILRSDFERGWVECQYDSAGKIAYQLRFEYSAEREIGINGA